MMLSLAARHALPRPRLLVSAALAVALAACGGNATPPATAGAAADPVASSTPDTTPSAPAASVDTTPTPSASSPPPPPAAPAEQFIAIAPLKIVSTEKGKELIWELKADGSIVDKDGATKGKIDGRTVTFDGLTEPLWTVDKDGNVTWAFFKEAKGKFDANDALTMEMPKKKMKAVVDDAGKMTITGDGKAESPPWRVEGMTPKARRAAVLLSMSIARKKRK